MAEPELKLVKKGLIDPSPYLSVSDDRKAALWLQELVEKSQDGVTTQVLDLTPTIARTLLRRNQSNRTISEKIVEGYVRDMRNGAWKFNGEPVIVAKDGNLNDGQHRAMAVILSDVSVPVVLIVGVERDTRTTLDQGRVRTVGDYLAMTGYHYTNVLAATAKMVWQWRKYGYVGNGHKIRPTKGEVLHTVEEIPGLMRSVSAIDGNGISAAGSASMLAFCHYAMGVASNKGDVDRFIRGISMGENLSSDSPILYARNRLLMEKSRLKVGERAELLFRAWNAWRREETPRSLPILGGELPQLES